MGANLLDVEGFLARTKTIDCTVTDPEPGIRDASGYWQGLGQSNMPMQVRWHGHG
jgi:hypothetical protein